MAVHPSDPDIVYAMTHASTFFVSLDGGESWNALGTVPTMASIETIAVDPFDPEDIFAGSGWDGFYRSTDGGRTWTDRSEGLDDGGRRVRKVIADHSAEGILYIATSQTQTICPIVYFQGLRKSTK